MASKQDNTIRTIVCNGYSPFRAGPTIEVFIRDMGLCATPHNSPIYVKHEDGKWTLTVWADINQEDPTHVIDLNGAMESARRT